MAPLLMTKVPLEIGEAVVLMAVVAIAPSFLPLQIPSAIGLSAAVLPVGLPPHLYPQRGKPLTVEAGWW
ncbi:hypothetical protein DO97_18990 [Neosynechococcus sphagnicola sy1]|uniref:Uncharacterized protein n=1 Tax=Neosynechococcus sphagnicola sy1 TaxID=1497020 RepID=A0A098TMR1_9CYAN|nr:hypothetical protein DO97_18990 [Neosynechococcus sphagnicola sy1]